jgi:HTH-type transcriptional regulator/antitoxin HigA
LEVSTAISDYRELISDVQPEVVHDEALNQRFIQRLAELDANWDALTSAERKLHELLVLIIQDFEKRTYKVRAATPIEVIEDLLEANGLKRKELVGIFATESIVSEVLNGNRKLTVDHIKKLAERFNVSPAVFF